MGDQTSIEWTRGEDGTPGSTWNPVIGCSRVSEECDGCYAIGVVHRGMSAQHLGLTIKRAGEATDWTGELRLVPHLFDQPTRWTSGRRIFVNSLSDLFHPAMLRFPDLDHAGAPCARCVDGEVTVKGETRTCPACNGTHLVDLGLRRPRIPLVHILTEMVANPQHTFLVLTKRPRNMAGVLANPMIRLEVNAALMERGLPVMPGGMSDPDFRWPGHIQWGTSIGMNKYAFRADHLRRINGVTWVSAEPLLEALPDLDLTGIDWLVVGGETGPKARPMDPSWARDLRDRCTVPPDAACNCLVPAMEGAGQHDPGCSVFRWQPTAFFFKQWGDWAPAGAGVTAAGRTWTSSDGRAEVLIGQSIDHPGWQQIMRKVGKKAAGRELDGRTWDEMPS